MSQFEYGVSRIRDLQVRTNVNKKGQTEVTEVILAGEPVRPSERFWTSLHMRFGFTSNIFRYFRHDEVFTRISEVNPNDEIRWCLERNKNGQGKLLAVTSLTAPIITHDDLAALLRRYGAESIDYSEGIVSSRHAPRLADTFTVAGDSFQNKYVLEVPIDGFGRPQAYLSLLRLVCSNGAVGYSRTFRSELNLGRGSKGVDYSLTRMLEGFNNEEGYAALRQRFESAARSWASVHEVNRLYRTLLRANHRGGLHQAKVIGTDGAAEAAPWQRSFHQLTGDLTSAYGLVNLDALSVKRQRTLPAACKVYDLLNFTSELATHHAGTEGNRMLQAYIGDLVSSEYDLEGTADHFGDWKDFFVGREETTSTLAALHRR